METFSKKVSMAVVRRLPKYYRYLNDLITQGQERISSKELGEMMGLTASQIRQDLNCFGGYGQQGYGYNIMELKSAIEVLLGIDHKHTCIIVGAGNLGLAIANYDEFKRKGFELKAMFDIDPKLVDANVRGIRIFHVKEMTDFIKLYNVKIGILCVPKEHAQIVADEMIDAGVSAIWNFAPTDLKVPDGVIIENVNLSESLFTLSYLLNE